MDGYIENTVLSDLIGSIYDCAIRPDLWGRTLEVVAEVIGCEKVILSLDDTAKNRTLINQSVGWDSRWKAEREKHLPEIHNALKAWLLEERDQNHPFVASQELPPEVFSGSPYYHQCLVPQGISDVAHFFLMHSERNLSELVLFQQLPNTCIQNHEIERAKILVPHLRRAVTISNLLDIQSVSSTTMEAVLNLLSVAVFILGKDLDILFCNSSAEFILKSDDPIRSSQGKLRLTSAGATEVLRNAVLKATREDFLNNQKGYEIPISGRNDIRFLLHVLPLRSGAVRSGLVPGASAAIFLSPSTCRPKEFGTALAALFDLTMAELAVLERIVLGEILSDVSASLGITTATVKTHLQHIFDKTGVRRQSDLIQLVSSFMAPLRG